METRNNFFSQTVTVLTGELILSAAMVGIFGALGYFDRSILLGAAAGSLIAALNHALLVLGVIAASEKAEKQNVRGGQAIIQLSYMVRLIGLLLILILCARSGLFHLPALLIPLLFARPILTISEHLNKRRNRL